MNNATHTAFIGLTNNVIITAGIIPINGPKYGIILVRPTIIASKSAYGASNTLFPK